MVVNSGPASWISLAVAVLYFSFYGKKPQSSVRATVSAVEAVTCDCHCPPVGYTSWELSVAVLASFLAGIGLAAVGITALSVWFGFGVGSLVGAGASRARDQNQVNPETPGSVIRGIVSPYALDHGAESGRSRTAAVEDW